MNTIAKQPRAAALNRLGLIKFIFYPFILFFRLLLCDSVVGDNPAKLLQKEKELFQKEMGHLLKEIEHLQEEGASQEILRLRSLLQRQEILITALRILAD